MRRRSPVGHRRRGTEGGERRNYCFLAQYEGICTLGEAPRIGELARFTNKGLFEKRRVEIRGARRGVVRVMPVAEKLATVTPRGMIVQLERSHVNEKTRKG